MKRNDDIRNYLRGDRRGKAANRLEREALSDPFLHEALEGYDVLPGNDAGDLERLERMIDRKGYRGRKMWWGYIAAASLLVGVFLFLWKQEEPGEELSRQEQLATVTSLPAEQDRQVDMVVEDSVVEKSGVVSLERVKVMQDEPVEHVVQEEPEQKQLSRAVMPRMQMMEKETRTLPVNDSGGATVTGWHHVAGRVTDSLGRPLPGVVVRAASWGTATDASGRFSLRLPDSLHSLNFAYIGMEAAERSFVPGDSLRVVLRDTDAFLGEMVVTGYGNSRKKPFVGAATRVETVREDSLGVYLTSVLKEKAGKWFADGIREFEVTFKVGKDGRVVRPRVLQAPSVEVERSVEKALLEAPVWEERFRGERLRGILRLEEKDGQVRFSFRLR